MTLQEQIAVMTAADGGAMIERSPKNKGQWRPDDAPAWNWANFDYRVKETRQYFCIEDDARVYAIFDDKKEARRQLDERYKPRSGSARVTELIVKPRTP